MNATLEPFNIQEARVRQAYDRLHGEVPLYCGCNLCRQDVLALALNRLPPKYRQRGTVCLQRPYPPDTKIDEAVLNALAIVAGHPKH